MRKAVKEEGRRCRKYNRESRGLLEVKDRFLKKEGKGKKTSTEPWGLYKDQGTKSVTSQEESFWGEDGKIYPKELKRSEIIANHLGGMGHSSTNLRNMRSKTVQNKKGTNSYQGGGLWKKPTRQNWRYSGSRNATQKKKKNISAFRGGDEHKLFGNMLAVLGGKEGERILVK